MIYAVLLAGGVGKRMNTSTKKQFIKINNKEVIDYSIEKLLSIKNISKLIIVINNDDIKKYNKYRSNKKIDFVFGGKERYNSVFNALNYINDNYKVRNNDKVIIHDSARPNVKIDDIKKLINCLSKYKVVTLASKIYDTIKEVEINKKDIKEVKKTLNRDKLYSIVTPQGFNFKILYNSYLLYNNSIRLNKKHTLNVTDDLQIIENYSKEKVYILESSRFNYKLTTKDDINLFKYLLK